MSFINQNNIPLPLAVWLAYDGYDYQEDPNAISATSLLKPTKQLILAARVPQKDQVEDIVNRVASSMGSAIHEHIEVAWHNYEDSMKALGYPQRVIDKILLNPTKEQVKADPDCIPVYMEQRAFKKVGKWKVSGKFDFVAEGRVEDFKSTSTFAFMNDSKDEDYILQGSIYRWLNPEIITDDKMRINFIFTDWSKANTFSNPKYPKAKVASKEFTLRSVMETDRFVSDKLIALETLWDKPEEEIPECTDKELWRSETKWKYFSKPDAKRATKVFDNPLEANQHLAAKGVGIVKEFKGQVKACAYCPAVTVCKQKDKYF